MIYNKDNIFEIADKSKILKEQFKAEGDKIRKMEEGNLKNFLNEHNDNVKDIYRQIYECTSKNDLESASYILKDEISNIKGRIAYLEYLKHKKLPITPTEQLEYNNDLDDFIDFLDDKFKEWEKKSIKKFKRK